MTPMKFLKKVYPMTPNSPLKERYITLVKLNNIHYWTCSACYWKLPLNLDPMAAVNKFSSHACADHGVPTGTQLPATQAYKDTTRRAADRA